MIKINIDVRISMCINKYGFLDLPTNGLPYMELALKPMFS
jgi:hypothetical protein